MVSLDKAVVIVLETHGKNFEVFVDPELALGVRRGKDFTPELLAVEDIFLDARSGDRPADEDLLMAFGTKDIIPCAEKIVRKGKFHLTTEQKKKLVDEKKRAIIAEIARNAINPQTKLPHPPQRIENAMAVVKVNIDPFLSVSEQMKDVISKIKSEIPISFEKRRMAVKIPAKFAPKIYGAIKRLGGMEKESWGPDGSLCFELEFPAGMQDKVYDIINSHTHGDSEINVLD